MPTDPAAAHPPMITVELDELHAAFGFGVAGNFAGHLDQAGEAADFASVVPAAPDAPKGIFPWFAPVGEPGYRTATPVPAFLHAFPLSQTRIAAPSWAAEDPAANLQIEPEVGVLARVTYDHDGVVRTLRPYAIGAFNDCSIRRPGATKISEKKNWGKDSKGIARELFRVGDLTPDGPTASFRLASFLVRDGETHAYGVDSPLPGYSYYGNQLLVWLMERLVNQHGSVDTPLEPVGDYLRGAGQPRSVLIGIGATRYTPLGASTFLQPGDTSVVVVYDGAVHQPDEIQDAVAAGTESQLLAVSVLRQAVYAA